MVRKEWLAGVVIVVVAALGGGFALAHGGDASQIHGCVDKKGDLSVIGADESCSTQETPLDWNIVGPKGDTGGRGETGPAGSPGATGGPATHYQEVIGSLAIDGLPGPIEILGFDTKVSNPGTFAGGGGGGAGKATLSDFSITKTIDAASPFLAVDTARGKHFREASIEIYRPGTTTPHMTYELSDLLITLVRDHDSGISGQPSLEEIALNFTGIEWEFTTVTGGTTTGCWDQARNQAC